MTVSHGGAPLQAEVAEPRSISAASMLPIPLKRLPISSLDRRRHVQGSFLRRGRRLDQALIPVRASLGTHYVFANVGSPPQRVSLIIDTGSYNTAFPCKGCDVCRLGQRQAFWDPEVSKTAHLVDCDECHGSYACTKTSLERCKYKQAYSEGSSWTANQVMDFMRLGDEDMPQDDMINEAKVHFGCIQEQSGMFDTQAADGIIGLGPHEDSVLWQMAELQDANKRKFSLCFSERGGHMVFGGFDPMLLEPGEYHLFTPMTMGTGWFVVQVEAVALGETQIADARVVKELAAGIGTIVDSGTTDTYLPVAIAANWKKAWEHATGKVYNNCEAHAYCMPMTAQELASLPVFSITLAGGVVLSLRPEEYMEAGPRSVGSGVVYAPRIYLTEDSGAVLGANLMMNRNILFDLSESRLGFAKARCDYVKEDGSPPSKAAAARDEVVIRTAARDVSKTPPTDDPEFDDDDDATGMKGKPSNAADDDDGGDTARTSSTEDSDRDDASAERKRGVTGDDRDDATLKGVRQGVTDGDDDDDDDASAGRRRHGVTDDDGDDDDGDDDDGGDDASLQRRRGVVDDDASSDTRRRGTDDDDDADDDAGSDSGATPGALSKVALDVREDLEQSRVSAGSKKSSQGSGGAQPSDDDDVDAHSAVAGKLRGAETGAENARAEHDPRDKPPKKDNEGTGGSSGEGHYLNDDRERQEELAEAITYGGSGQSAASPAHSSVRERLENMAGIDEVFEVRDYAYVEDGPPRAADPPEQNTGANLEAKLTPGAGGGGKDAVFEVQDYAYVEGDDSSGNRRAEEALAASRDMDRVVADELVKVPEAPSDNGSKDAGEEDGAGSADGGNVDCKFELVETSPCEADCPAGLTSPLGVQGSQKFTRKILAPAQGSGEPCPEGDDAAVIIAQPCDAVCEPGEKLGDTSEVGDDAVAGIVGHTGKQNVDTDEGSGGDEEGVAGGGGGVGGAYTREDATEARSGGQGEIRSGGEKQGSSADGTELVGREEASTGQTVQGGGREAAGGEATVNTGGDEDKSSHEIGDAGHEEEDCVTPRGMLWGPCGKDCTQRRLGWETCKEAREERDCHVGTLCRAQSSGIVAELSFRLDTRDAGLGDSRAELVRLHASDAIAEALAARLSHVCDVLPGDVSVDIHTADSEETGDAAVAWAAAADDDDERLAGAEKRSSGGNGGDFRRDDDGSWAVASVHVVDPAAARPVSASMRFQLDACVEALSSPAIAQDVASNLAKEFERKEAFLPEARKLAEELRIVEVGPVAVRSAPSGYRLVDNSRDGAAAVKDDRGVQGDAAMEDDLLVHKPVSLASPPSAGSSPTAVFAVQAGIVVVVAVLLMARRWRSGSRAGEHRRRRSATEFGFLAAGLDEEGGRFGSAHRGGASGRLTVDKDRTN